jgi:PPOX class probable F420-dependent enzyme
MGNLTLNDLSDLLAAPAPAVLTTLRADGTPLASPVWFHFAGDAVEVVIAKGDVKLKHLGRDPHCSLVVFETVPPFRGVEFRGAAELRIGGVGATRHAIARRYLGLEKGDAFTERRAGVPATVCRLPIGTPRIWSLARLLDDGEGSGGFDDPPPLLHAS